MRRSIGNANCSGEVIAMLKLAILLHELGHVSDFEQGINYSNQEIDLQNAEVYAHHFACRALIRGKYRIALGWYLQQLEELARFDRSAKSVTKSKMYKMYQREVSRFYQKNRGTACSTSSSKRAESRSRFAPLRSPGAIAASRASG
jgi:hypothetical protein